MSRSLRWGLGAVLVAAMAGFLAWAFLTGRAELKRAEDPKPPEPRRVSRNPAGDAVLTLDADSQAGIGLRVAELEDSTLPREVAGYGRVLDPGSLVTLLSEVTAAEAQAAVARAQYEQARALHESVKGIPQNSVEAAKAESIGRESRARAAAASLTNAWGVGIASLPAAEREALADRLVKREAALVRVDLPAGEVIAELPAGGAVVPLADQSPRLNAERVFESPHLDEKIQGQSFLLYVALPRPGGSDSASPARVLSPGAVLAAYLQLPGDPAVGVLIPRSAVVRLEGMPWVYVQGGPEKFFRREVHLEHPLEKGWFTRSGFAAKDRVVVAGAQALLSDELRYQIELEDD